MLTQTISIDGMTCQNCVNHVRGALLAVAQVRAVMVDLGGGTARVESDSEIPREALSSALQAAGYALK